MANLFTKISRAAGFGTLTNWLPNLFNSKNYGNGAVDSLQKIIGQPVADNINAWKDLVGGGSNTNSAVTESNSGITVGPDGSISLGNVQNLDDLGSVISEAVLGGIPEFQRLWTSAENQKARDWETEMSNSAYQRSVADMKSAGINPILAYSQGGASTPAATVTGSSNSAQGVSSLMNSVANIINAVMSNDNKSDALQQKAAMDMMKFNQKNSAMKTDADYKKSYVALNNARTSLYNRTKPAETKINIIKHK